MTTINKILLIPLLLICLINRSFSQEPQNQVIINYIQTYQELAIKEMLRTGVPASITLAQGILETEAGQSDLVTRSNNHFGIKCKTSWTGEKVYHDDDARGECFRKYEAAEDSYRDHSDYLRSQPRYASLFKLDPLDYKGWATGLKKAGYATNPKYAHILIKYIEKYNLDNYSLVALGRKAPESLTVAVDQPKPSAGNRQKEMKDISISTQPIPVTENKDVPGNDQMTQLAKPSKPKPVYPSGEFMLNDTRVVFEKEGISLLALAEQYNVKLGWLLDFNDLPSGADILKKDQLVFLQRKRRQSHNEYHIVEQGESLYDIAQLEALRLETMLDYNQLERGMAPAPGEKLYLQQHAPGRPALAQAEEITHKPGVDIATGEDGLKNTVNVDSLMHKVQPKETLFGLSKKYQVDINKIREWNNLQEGELRTGQELLIYKNR
jgi:Mannosyl-glycoprotein endo-beta-N-acetylglucosaminidase/LysM domain